MDEELRIVLDLGGIDWFPIHPPFPEMEELVLLSTGVVAMETLIVPS